MVDSHVSEYGTRKLRDQMSTNKPANSDEPSLAARLRLAVVRLNRRLRSARSDETSITLTQLSALFVLSQHGPMSPSELAIRERVRPPSMTRVLDTLENCGYVARKPHSTDRRQSVLALTDAGAEYIHAEVCARERWLDERLAELAEDDRMTLWRAAKIIERIAET